MRKFRLILILPILLLSLAGCQPLTSASDEKISIVATYSILGAIVKDIVGDKATVTVAVPNGLDIHEWEPSAKDIEAINKADLVVRNGLGLESGLEKTLETAQNSGVRIFTATDHIECAMLVPVKGFHQMTRTRQSELRSPPVDKPFNDKECSKRSGN